jgi:hypothetical protein
MVNKKKRVGYRDSKTRKVLEHLQSNGSITSWEAIELYGATRLSAIIFNLRKHYKIESIDKVKVNKHGDTTTYAKYVYCGEIG